MQQLIKDICLQTGLEFKSYRPVSGGDINDSFAIETASGPVFLKLNNAAKYPGMFQKEAEGLNALRTTGGLKIPAVLATGYSTEWQYLVLEHLNKVQPPMSFWQEMASGLCLQHQHTSTHFGWHCSNYIGSLVQQNRPTDSWADFYAHQRILPLCERLVEELKLSASDILMAEKLADRLQDIFPAEPPALLHGDLWAGNFMAVGGNSQDSPVQPCLYDPAVYYGHR